MFVPGNNSARCAFEMEPREIARPSTDQRLSKGEKSYEETGGDRVELRFDSRAQHIRDRDAKSAAKHQIGNDAERGQKDSKSKKKNGERKPFDAAQVAGHLRLRRGINRLEQALAKNSVVDDRPVDEPTEPRRPVNLPTPLGRARRPEKDQMLETKH